MIAKDPGYVMLANELAYEPYLAGWLRTSAPARWVDLGAGQGGPAVRFARALKGVDRVAVDAVAPDAPSPGWRVVVSDIDSYLDRMEPDPGALVSLFDVIEHFPRDAGERLLDRICALTGWQVLFTPLGFFPQDPTVRPELEPFPYMWHQSGWGIEDFLRRGFAVAAFPLYHRRRGALLAFRRSGWSVTERAEAGRAMRALYLRRALSPVQAAHRVRDALFYWFGEEGWYARGRALARWRGSTAPGEGAV